MSSIQNNEQGCSRIITFFDEVDDVSVHQAILAIHEINEEDKLLNQDFLTTYPKAIPPPPLPIILDIQSVGGCVRDGFSLIAAIEQSNAPVHTRVNGYAFSMAFLIFLAGKERYMSRHAEVMYHQLSSSSEGTLFEIQQDILVSERLLKQMEAYVLERTQVSLTTLSQAYTQQLDVYFSPTESLSLGIATKII